MNRKLPYVFTLLLFLFINVIASQDLTVNYFDESDYVRNDLFQEQDKIYGKSILYSQGMELICRQDKVKAEIQGLGTYYTPLDLNNIPTGNYDISLSKTGYKTYNFQVSVSSDKRTSIIVNLAPLSSMVELLGIPKDSRIYINNSLMESPIFEVQQGQVSLRIIAFGYEDYIEVLEIEDDKVSFTPQLDKKEFAIQGIELNRNISALNDSPNQQRIIVALKADAPGNGIFSLINKKESSILIEEEFQISKEITNFSIDPLIDLKGITGDYIIEIKGISEDKEEFVQTSFTVLDGGRSRWRNVYSGLAGFLYCPDPLSLPQGQSQIHTGFTVVVPNESIDNLYIPSHLSVRTSFFDRLELVAGTALYLSPNVDESSIDLFLSGKYGLLRGVNNQGFNLSVALSANYNGNTKSFDLIPAYDPYGGVSGLSLSLPTSFTVSSFSFILAPELRLSSSYPLINGGGFTSGDFHVWSYIRGSIVFDYREISAAISAALQSPSFTGDYSSWPVYTGLDLVFTPGYSGFSFGINGGFRYCKDENLQYSAGMTAGFMF